MFGVRGGAVQQPLDDAVRGMCRRIRDGYACSGWRRHLHGVCGGPVQLCVHREVPCVRGRIDDEHTGEPWRYYMHGVRGGAEQCIADSSMCTVRGGPVPGQWSTDRLLDVWRRFDNEHVEQHRGRELHGVRSRSAQRFVGCGVCAIRGWALSGRSRTAPV